MSTRTYYRGPDAVVTDKLFVWRTTPTRGFVVRDLRNVQLIRSRDGVGPYAAPIAAGTVVLAATLWTMFDAPAVYALGALAVVGPAGVAIGIRMRPRRWELHATYRGARVVLYASADARIFNQVVRGLRRAVEAARPPSDDHDLVAA